MPIFGILFLAAIVIYVGVDCYKSYQTLRRCPVCGKMAKQKFDLLGGETKYKIVNTNGTPQKVNIFKCDNCGHSWNNIQTITQS